MSFIFSPKRKNLPFLLINNYNLSLPENIVKPDCMMWADNNTLSRSNPLKEVL